jgi:hypothetical protein
MTTPHNTYRTEALTGWPLSATSILTERANRADEYFPSNQHAREEFTARAVRAIVLAEQVHRVLHGYWRTIDHAVTAGQAEGPGWWDTECEPRADQEKHLAEWAFAHAARGADANPDLTADLDILLDVSLGFDARDIATALHEGEDRTR